MGCVLISFVHFTDQTRRILQQSRAIRFAVMILLLSIRCHVDDGIDYVVTLLIKKWISMLSTAISCFFIGDSLRFAGSAVIGRNRSPVRNETTNSGHVRSLEEY